MDEPKVRKDFRITPAQDRKVKAIAAMRGCTEAEVIRSAIADYLDSVENGSVPPAAPVLPETRPQHPGLPASDE